MDDTTKILSVSYGNFSCHLEGFDDSVETMKTVVSYFHELAGHDRFMDMDPQAPDMETLARLTEEQVGAPVEVEAEGNSVSMRMATADDADDAFDDTDDGDTIVLNTQDDEDDLVAHEAAADEAASEDDDDDVGAIDVDSVAAKLQRIRAVVSHDDDKVADDDADTFTEDLAEGEQVQTAAPGNPLAMRLAELAKRNSERAAEEAGIVLDLDEDDDTDLSEEELAELDAEFAAEEALEDTAADTLEDTVEDFAADEDDDDLIAEPELEADDEVAAIDADEIAAAEVEDVAAEDVAAADALSDDVEAPAEDKGPLVLTDATPLPGADDEAVDASQELADDIDEAARDVAADEDKRSDLRDNVDANMSRILSQTDEHLAEPEGRRHRDAFAQLKAAVAATEAARQLGDAGATERDKNEVFRDDLGALDAQDEQEKAAAEEIVDNVADDVEAAAAEDEQLAEAPAEGPLTLDTPVEDPQAEEAPVEDVAGEPAPASQEPAAPAPAPLKLVSSQPAKAEEAPLDAASARLRQIADQKEAAPTTKDGFAEFAKLHNATELADLLEAAAAYIGFVDGEDDFSRPQVMKKVQSASDTEFSREDGLRAFGRLLRMNRLVKLSNGRFQVAEDTQYRPENKAAQG